MTKRTEQKELYLAALRGDATAQRKCTSAGKACGGRCIPKHWNCRIKGEGEVPPTRGNKVKLSTAQKQAIAKARRNRRIRAVGTAGAIAGGLGVVAAFAARNPNKARRLLNRGRGVAPALGVAGAIPGPTRKGALAANLGLAGVDVAGQLGANYGSNRRGRRLFRKYIGELDQVNKKLKSLDGRHTKLQEKLLNARQVEEAAKVGFGKRGTNKYGLNNATRSIASQDRIRTRNLKAAEARRRKAQYALNNFNKETGYESLIAKQIRLKKASNGVKNALLGSYNSKDLVGDILNDYRRSYSKGFNFARRQVRGLGLPGAKPGPKPNPLPMNQRPELQADSADEPGERVDKKCGNSGIPDNWKCTKTTKAIAENKGVIAVGAVYAGAAGAALGAGLLASRNARIRGKLKFGGNDRITPFSGSIGDADGVMKNFRARSAGGESMFGDVLIGKSGDKNVVVKKITGNKNNINPILDPVQQMKEKGLIDDKTASNLIKQRNSLMESEVTIAQAAGELGFGPKVVAAKKNTLIMEVAEGKPLMDKYVESSPLGMKPKTKQLSESDKKQVLASMAKMHTGGIAHNDMHLGNTFQGDKGIQFIDFGTAQRGGGPVAMEFVRQMNPPRFGENYIQGNGYNLKSLDPRGYAKAEREIKKTIGKRVGTLRDNDIAKAVAKNPKIEADLQNIVDNYYTGLAGSRSDSADERVDKKCGNSGIPDNAKCTKKSTARTAAKAVAAAALVTGGALALRARKPSIKRASPKPGRRKGGLTDYQKEQLKKMRAKGTGKYGALPKRSTAAKQLPFYNEADRIYPVKHKRLFRDAEAADAEGKKYSKTVTDPKTGRKRTVKYGAKGYTIAPGTKRGNSYCARSFGDMKSHNKNCAGKDRNTPLCLSRAKWKCSGKTSRKDVGENRLGKPCGNSHIPKKHNCSKDNGSNQGVNKKAIAATVVAGAVGALAVGVALDARTLKKGFGIPPTPGFGSSMKKIMKEKGVGIQEASGIYYDRVVSKEGWKTGELVYTRAGKSADFSHYAIYMGKKDGVHTFAQMGADGIAANSGGIQETKYGPGVKAGERGAAIFARPPKEYRAKKTLSGDEIAKRIDALKGKPLKYEAFSDNCETWARMIVGDGTRSMQAQKLTLTTKTAIRGVYKGLGKIAKEWGDDDDFPVNNVPVLSARKMAKILDKQDPVGNVGAFEALLDRSRRDAITSKHLGLISADELLTDNMSAVEATARVKRYLILLSAITVDMNK